MIRSGITRRIDELGRIVIPKEMRYNLGIRDGEILELFLDNTSIIIKKYSQIENIKDISMNICKIISDAVNVDILITDREKIISSSDTLKDCVDLNITEEHKRLIDERESYISNKKEYMYNTNGYYTILPIITSSDSIGLVIIITNELSDYNTKYANIITKLIVNKIEG